MSAPQNHRRPKEDAPAVQTRGRGHLACRGDCVLLCGLPPGSLRDRFDAGARSNCKTPCLVSPSTRNSYRCALVAAHPGRRYSAVPRQYGTKAGSAGARSWPAVHRGAQPGEIGAGSTVGAPAADSAKRAAALSKPGLLSPGVAARGLPGPAADRSSRVYPRPSGLLLPGAPA